MYFENAFDQVSIEEVTFSPHLRLMVQFVLWHWLDGSLQGQADDGGFLYKVTGALFSEKSVHVALLRVNEDIQGEVLFAFASRWLEV